MANKKKFINTKWSPELAYVIGLLTSDGNLSPDGRHIAFTSKDLELASIVKRILKLSNKIGKKARGGSKIKKYYVTQFGSVDFYRFLLSIGLTPAKSKTLGKIIVPDRLFSHFLRGCIDGDGNIGEFLHPQSSRPQLRVRLASASDIFMSWIHEETKRHARVDGGWVYRDQKKSVFTLTFAKKDAIKILRFIYKGSRDNSLPRKKKTATKYLPPGWRNG